MASAFERGRLVFLEEARELNDELEQLLLELEEDPDNPELVNRTFRVMHTLKGSGSMFGFDKIASLTHEMETIFDQVRVGTRRVTHNLIGLTLEVHDRLNRMLEEVEGGQESDSGALSGLIQRLRDFLAQGVDDDVPASAAPKPAPVAEPVATPAPVEASESAAAPEPVAAPEPEPASAEEDLGYGFFEDLPQAPQPHLDAESPDEEKANQTYRISFKPEPQLFKGGTNPLLLLRELLELGEGNVVAQTEKILPLDQFNPEECRVYWEILLRTDRGINAVRDVFMFVEDDCDLKIREIEEDDERRIGEILLEQGVDEGHIVSALNEQQLFRNREQEHRREQERTREQANTSTIRVPFWKLNTLVDLVGELVTVQARLSQTVKHRSDSELLLLSEEVERLTADLRDTTMGIRMLPIGTLFGRFKRLIRDLSSELGKEVRLTTEGEDTELDKSVIEQLNDPLVHIIRNSMGHGIEDPEARQAKGKPRQGHIHLSARHVGAKVVIEVSDDGGGLDAEVIKKKAIERGLIRPDVELTEQELHELIFMPGFSTAKSVSSLSGRGVGMDVVKRNIESLGGHVSLSSTMGAGTKLSFRLPLTLAIIEGMLVRVGDESFIIPLSSVDEVVELRTTEIENSTRGQVMQVRDDLVPYLYIREMFDVSGTPPAIQQVVIIDEGAPIGFVVDYVVGEHQTVIKNLGSLYKNVVGISGATILGDGGIALILDVLTLTQKAGGSKNQEAS